MYFTKSGCHSLVSLAIFPPKVKNLVVGIFIYYNIYTQIFQLLSNSVKKKSPKCIFFTWDLCSIEYLFYLLGGGTVGRF